MTPAEFRERFGWEVRRIAHAMEHAWGNGCWGCERPYQEMPDGLHALTVDIIDPRAEPFWDTNCRILCRTCNIEKSDLTSDEIASKRRGWKRWLSSTRPQQQELWH